MKTLAENIQLRNSMGQILKDKYYSIACPKVQNQNLINFIIKLKNI